MPNAIPPARQPPVGFVAPTPQNTPLVNAPIASSVAPAIPATITEQDVDEVDRALDDLDISADARADIEDLPLPIRRRIEGLKGVHAEFIKLERQYKKEMLELDRKYAALYAPIFARRNAIIGGEEEPTDAEIAAGEEQSARDDPESEPLPPFDPSKVEEEEEEAKGVPEFWATALTNHVEIGKLITERDEGALRYLADIRLDYLPAETPGYKLSFHFTPNPYFTNDVLTKTYHYQDEVDYSGDYVYASAEGTTIDWKEDQDLTKTFEVRKQRNKNTNRTRTVKRAIATPSFFDFFSPPTPPMAEMVEQNAYSEEEIAELEDKLELDYQIGEDLKEKIIPRAIDYYTGKAMEYDADALVEEDDEGDEEEWDDEASDESENLPVKARRQVTKDNPKTDPGECKNQ